jgi:hypothetical protein
MPNWNTTDHRQTRESDYTTSYGDTSTRASDAGDYDGKSCSDYQQLSGRSVTDYGDIEAIGLFSR